ncbi:MAG: hypothetical protein ABL925_02850 [Methylococcales bacterium]
MTNYKFSSAWLRFSTRYVYLFMCVFFMLAGCSSPPGSSEIEQQVLPLLTSNDLKNIAEIKNLRKTNGFEIDADTYAVDIAYDLVFKTSFAELAKPTTDAIQDPQGKSDIFQGVANFFSGLNLMSLSVAYGNFKAGDSFSKQDRLNFIKTESGWMLSSQPKPAL